MRHAIAILGVLCLAAGLSCEKPEAQMPAPPVRPMAELKPAPDPKPSALTVARRPAPTTKRITRPTPLVAKPAPGTKPKEPPSALRTYTVRKKDTLWSIAKRLLGDGQRWKEIVAANPGLDPQKLMPGQTIRLPER